MIMLDREQAQAPRLMGMYPPVAVSACLLFAAALEALRHVVSNAVLAGRRFTFMLIAQIAQLGYLAAIWACSTYPQCVFWRLYWAIWLRHFLLPNICLHSTRGIRTAGI